MSNILKVEDFTFQSIPQALSQISEIQKVLDNLDSGLHILACSGLYNYELHGDLTVLTALAKAVSRYDSSSGKFDGRSVRGADMRAWITKHANIKWDKNAYKDASGVAQGGYVKAQTGPAVVKLEDAINNPFYKAKERVSSDLIDIRKVIDNAYKKVAKAVVDGTCLPEQAELTKQALEALRPLTSKKQAVNE